MADGMIGRHAMEAHHLVLAARADCSVAIGGPVPMAEPLELRSSLKNNGIYADTEALHGAATAGARAI
jgi:hypothetical protein